MIDWNLTKIKFNRINLDGRRPRVAVVCDECGKQNNKRIYNKSLVINNQLPWLCKKCECNTEEYKNKVSASIKEKWQDKEYRDKASKANKEKWNKHLRNNTSKQIKNRNNKNNLSKAAKKRWQDREYRDKTSKAIKSFMKEKWKDSDYRQKISNQSKQLWEDDDYRNNQIKTSTELWKNDTYRNKVSSTLKNQSELISEKQKQVWNNDYLINKARNKSIKLWQDKNLIDETSKRTKELWQNEEYRNKQKLIHNSDEYISKLSSISKNLWLNKEYRTNISSKIKAKWQELEYKKRMAKIRSNQPRVSSIQKQLYSILDDLEIKHHREHNNKPNDSETIIGPYNFDCVIPLKNKKLLIECQGDYWHSLKKNIANDKSKATYIEKYHKDCEIKYLWEHEFKCLNKIQELIKYWTNKTTMELFSYNFKDLEIIKCKAENYKLLLSKYHYLPNAGRGGIAYGAYLNDELIAVCVFSPLVRQNLPWDKKSTRELSRLCIHPRYQKRNFASWFVSRCIKCLDNKYKNIISYCDTTFNHDGAVYKACNFKLDGEVKPDYWYVTEDGWVMHKKTLYNHAVKMGMKEKEYSELNGYKKIYGKKKLRFIYSQSQS